MSNRPSLAAVQAEPEDAQPPAPATTTVTVTGGEVTLTTTFTGEDFLTLHRLVELDATDLASLGRMYGPILEMLERHVVSHTIDRKAFLDRPMPVLLETWHAWHKAIQGEVLDPTTGSDSLAP